MSPLGRLIGWTDTSSLLIRPANSLRTIGNAMLIKPATWPLEARPPPPSESALASISTCGFLSISPAWFSSRRAIFCLACDPRPSSKPYLDHLSTSLLSVPRFGFISKPSDNCANVKDIFFSEFILLYIYCLINENSYSLPLIV